MQVERFHYLLVFTVFQAKALTHSLYSSLLVHTQLKHKLAITFISSQQDMKKQKHIAHHDVILPVHTQGIAEKI